MDPPADFESREMKGHAASLGSLSHQHLTCPFVQRVVPRAEQPLRLVVALSVAVTLLVCTFIIENLLIPHTLNILDDLCDLVLWTFLWASSAGFLVGLFTRTPWLLSFCTFSAVTPVAVALGGRPMVDLILMDPGWELRTSVTTLLYCLVALLRFVSASRTSLKIVFLPPLFIYLGLIGVCSLRVLQTTLARIKGRRPGRTDLGLRDDSPSNATVEFRSVHLAVDVDDHKCVIPPPAEIDLLKSVTANQPSKFPRYLVVSSVVFSLLFTYVDIGSDVAQFVQVGNFLRRYGGVDAYMTTMIETHPALLDLTRTGDFPYLNRVIQTSGHGCIVTDRSRSMNLTLLDLPAFLRALDGLNMSSEVDRCDCWANTLDYINHKELSKILSDVPFTPLAPTEIADNPLPGDVTFFSRLELREQCVSQGYPNSTSIAEILVYAKHCDKVLGRYNKVFLSAYLVEGSSQGMYYIFYLIAFKETVKMLLFLLLLKRFFFNSMQLRSTSWAIYVAHNPVALLLWFRPTSKLSTSWLDLVENTERGASKKKVADIFLEDCIQLPLTIARTVGLVGVGDTVNSASIFSLTTSASVFSFSIAKSLVDMYLTRKERAVELRNIAQISNSERLSLETFTTNHRSTRSSVFVSKEGVPSSHHKDRVRLWGTFWGLRVFLFYPSFLFLSVIFCFFVGGYERSVTNSRTNEEPVHDSWDYGSWEYRLRSLRFFILFIVVEIVKLLVFMVCVHGASPRVFILLAPYTAKNLLIPFWVLLYPKSLVSALVANSRLPRGILAEFLPEAALFAAGFYLLVVNYLPHREAGDTLALTFFSIAVVGYITVLFWWAHSYAGTFVSGAFRRPLFAAWLGLAIWGVSVLLLLIDPIGLAFERVNRISNPRRHGVYQS